MFFFPWYPALMLAVEAGDVITNRIMKITLGGPAASAEAVMMVGEKLDATIGAGSIVASGGTPADVISFYRAKVAINAARLG